MISGMSCASCATALLLFGLGTVLNAPLAIVLGTMTGLLSVFMAVGMRHLPRREPRGTLTITAAELEIQDMGEVTTLPLDAIHDVQAGDHLRLSVGGD